MTPTRNVYLYIELPAEVARADNEGLSTNCFRPLLDMHLLTSGDALDATEGVLKASCVPSASASCVFRFGRANLFGIASSALFSAMCVTKYRAQSHSDG